MKKIIVSLLGIILVFSIGGIGGFANKAKAAENEAAYDMIQGGTQEFTILNDDQEEIHITVEEETSLIRAVKNGTYKISSEQNGSWKASYEIVVSDNKITQAKNPSATAYTGSFISKSLQLESSKQATYYLTKETGLLVNNLQVRSTLSGSSILITN